MRSFALLGITANLAFGRLPLKQTHKRKSILQSRKLAALVQRGTIAQKEQWTRLLAQKRLTIRSGSKTNRRLASIAMQAHTVKKQAWLQCRVCVPEDMFALVALFLLPRPRL